MNCVCCSSQLLRYIDSSGLYWYCRECHFRMKIIEVSTKILTAEPSNIGDCTNPGDRLNSELDHLRDYSSDERMSEKETSNVDLYSMHPDEIALRESA